MNSTDSHRDQDASRVFDPKRYRIGYIASAFGLLVTGGLALYGWFNTEPGQQIPIHFDASGQADGYGSRFTAFWAMPLLVLGISVLFAVLPRIDPRRRGVAKSAKAYNVVWAATIGLLVVVTALTTSTALANSGVLLGGRLVTVALGVLFAIIGNFMPKTGSNWFLGIRTPWTLSDDTVWVDTHRVGGMLMLIGGAIVVVIGLIAPESWGIAAALIMVIAVALITTLYSYVRYRALHPAT